MSDESKESLMKFDGEMAEKSGASSRSESKSASFKEHDDDDSVKQGNRTTATPTPRPSRDEDMIDKGVRFCTHPSLRNTPSEQKMNYLKSRGLTTNQIHEVWDRIVLADGSDADKERMNERPDVHSNDMISSSAALPHPPQPTFSLHGDPPQYPQPVGAPYQVPHQSTTEDDALFVPTLLTIGGLLGITAAAAVRWLNGGDFCLFPRPTRVDDHDSRNNTLERHTPAEETALHLSTRESPFEQNREYELYNSVIEEEQNQSEQHSQDLAETLETVVQSLQTQCSQQERILQQLSNQSNKQVTDQSMDLLKYPGNQNKSHGIDAMSRLMVWSKLVEIKAALTNLESTGQAANLSDKWERLMEDIESCLAALKVDETTSSTLNAESSSDGSLDNHSETAASTPPGHYCATSSMEMTSPLRSAIVQLATENEPTALQAGSKFLYLYILHLSSHPHVPRYRKIMTSNESFQQVEQLAGGKEVLLAVGFVERDNFLEWEPSNSDEVSDHDLMPLKEASAALSILTNRRQGDSTDTVLTSALACLSYRASSPPPEAVMSVDALDSQFKTPTNAQDFIVSPPTTKKLSHVETPGPQDAPETPLSLMDDGTVVAGSFNLSAVSEQGHMDDALGETATMNEDLGIEKDSAMLRDSSSLTPPEQIDKSS